MTTEAVTRKVAPGVLGMILFIVSEIMFFGALGAAYLSLRSSEAVWPPAGTVAPGLVLPVIATFALLASSFTQHRSATAGRDGDGASARRWLALTIALGAAFLAGQAWEWSQLLAEGTTLGSDAYGTSFFTLTGAHGIHVIGGLAMLTATWMRLGHGLGGRREATLEAVTYYWHFVDAVWVGVFTLVYLSV
jgi:cytochrome c oxidase subunit 3